MRDVYEATKLKQDSLFAQDYNVVVMSLCEWERLKKEDDNLRSLVKSFDLVSRLKPRGAFYGKRTNALKRY